MQNRATQVLASDRSKPGTSVRVTLTWAHPELHPVLYTNALGSPMPAPGGGRDRDRSGATASKGERWIEVRVEKSEVEALARLGAEMLVTVVFDEIGKEEKVVRVLALREGGPSTCASSIGSGEVTRG
ncbi:MAG: hypothetical protein U0263_39170 [Polyangiaceae bacterium]